MKYFYAEVIKIETVFVKLDELNLTDKQKTELADLIDSTIHHTVLDTTFSRLSPQDRRIFAEKVKQDPADQSLMEFLNDKIDNIEEEISSAVEGLIKELEKDIEEVKRISIKI